MLLLFCIQDIFFKNSLSNILCKDFDKKTVNKKVFLNSYWLKNTLKLN